MKVVSRPPGDWSVTADWDDGHVSVVQVRRTAPTARRSVDYPAFGRPIRFRLSKSALADQPPGGRLATPHLDDQYVVRSSKSALADQPPGGRLTTPHLDDQYVVRSSKSALADQPPGGRLATLHLDDQYVVRSSKSALAGQPPGGRLATYFGTCNRPAP
ncbi:MAG: hypothetical protein FWE95_00940 [Planctomycetaceae bacterium]|nr:hypothetical protein [Planctomycetaceae bacterium]